MRPPEMNSLHLLVNNYVKTQRKFMKIWPYTGHICYSGCSKFRYRLYISLWPIFKNYVETIVVRHLRKHPNVFLKKKFWFNIQYILKLDVVKRLYLYYICSKFHEFSLSFDTPTNSLFLRICYVWSVSLGFISAGLYSLCLGLYIYKLIKMWIKVMPSQWNVRCEVHVIAQILDPGLTLPLAANTNSYICITN